MGCDFFPGNSAEGPGNGFLYPKEKLGSQRGADKYQRDDHRVVIQAQRHAGNCGSEAGIENVVKDNGDKIDPQGQLGYFGE